MSKTTQSLPKAILILSFVLILLKQFLSLSRSVPRTFSTVEAVLTVAVILIFFRGFQGDRRAVKTCAYIGMLIGAIYVLMNIYLYADGDDTIYFTFYVAILQIILGVALLLKPMKSTEWNARKSYSLALVPIGYIILLAMHQPYPVEANISMFALQLLIVILFAARPEQPGKKFLWLSTALLLLNAASFIFYFVLSATAGLIISAAAYLSYGCAVAGIALKEKPYHAAAAQ